MPEIIIETSLHGPFLQTSS